MTLFGTCLYYKRASKEGREEESKRELGLHNSKGRTMSATITIQGTKNTIAPGASLKDVLELFSVPEGAKIVAGDLELTKDMNYRFVDGANIDISWEEPDVGKSDGSVIRMAVYASQIKVLNNCKGGSGVKAFTPQEFKTLPTSAIRRHAIRVVDLKIETGEMQVIWEK